MWAIIQIELAIFFATEMNTCSILNIAIDVWFKILNRSFMKILKGRNLICMFMNNPGLYFFHQSNTTGSDKAECLTYQKDEVFLDKDVQLFQLPTHELPLGLNPNCLLIIQHLHSDKIFNKSVIKDVSLSNRFLLEDSVKISNRKMFLF